MQTSIAVPTSAKRPSVATGERSEHRAIGRTAVLPRLLVLAVMFGSVWLGLRPILSAPASLTSSALPSDFSATRAMEHLQTIAAEPHPMGSAAHQAVEQYLLDQLTALGLQTEVQETTSLRQLVEYGQPDIVVGGRVRNVVARLPGTAGAQSILLSATYDAMPTTPGAADNGAGVATVLETVRALKAGPPLTSDVIVLLGDADTNGLIGEAAFASEHPWAHDVGLVVSFGAMGNNGPTFPASTSPESGRLVDVLIGSPHPLVYTWAPEVARATGTGGAALEYIQRGASTLMLASVAGWQANHTALDNLQNFDVRGLQQTGEYTLALVRTFASEDLRALRGPDRVALNLLPDRVVAYPSSWAAPLATVAVLALAVVLVVGLLRQRLTFIGLLLGALIFPLVIVASVILTTVGWLAIRSINPNHDVFIAGTFGITWYLIGFIALTALTFLAPYGWLRARVRELNMFGGVLMWWAGFACLTSVSLPSLSAILAWPLLAAVLLLAWRVASPSYARHSWVYALVLSAAAIAPLVMVAPLVYVLVPLTDKFAAMRGMPLLGVPILVAAMVAGLLVPQLIFLQPEHGRSRWVLPGVVLAAGVLFICAGWVASGFSPSQPRPDYLAYVLDSDSGQAYWVSVADQPDKWTQQFFADKSAVERIDFTPSPDYFPNRVWPALRTTAPRTQLLSPDVTVIEDTWNGDVRVIGLRVISPREANTIEVRLHADGPIAEAVVDGKPIDVPRALSGSHQNLRLVYEAPSSGGFEVVLTVRDAGPIAASLTDYSNGLPSGLAIPPRPADTMPAIFDFADPTIVSRSVVIRSVNGVVAP